MKATDDRPGDASRRAFIAGSIAAGAGALFVPRAIAALSADPACTPTSRDLYGLGPFHERDAPFRMRLAGPGEPGRRVTIAGVVSARDCAAPLADVVVDVWGANDAGCYTEIGPGGELVDDCTPRSDDPYNLRGRMRTGADGAYRFETVVPGRYLNGARFRPSHLHFIITPPEGAAIITQLYFEGDPYIEGDLGASDPNASARIIALTEGDEGLSGRFDIVLDVEPTSAIAMPGDAVVVDAIVPLASTSDGTTLRYDVSTPCRADVMVFDALGRHVRTLIDAVHAPGRYAERWDALDSTGARVAAGSYLCRLRTSSSVTSTLVVID